jgi:hypothetical protein
MLCLKLHSCTYRFSMFKLKLEKEVTVSSVSNVKDILPRHLPMFIPLLACLSRFQSHEAECKCCLVLQVSL